MNAIPHSVAKPVSCLEVLTWFTKGGLKQPKGFPPRQERSTDPTKLPYFVGQHRVPSVVNVRRLHKG